MDQMEQTSTVSALAEPGERLIDGASPSQSCAPLYLVRYGRIPEVTRCRLSDDELGSAGEFSRDTMVVVDTHRGPLLGVVLERLVPRGEPAAGPDEWTTMHRATAADLRVSEELTADCERQFSEWTARIAEWRLKLLLVDLEWTLDREKLILYVLCERGPETTNLALQAATLGLGVIEVQAVSHQGLEAPESGGGCGTKKGGGGGCGCSH